MYLKVRVWLRASPLFSESTKRSACDPLALKFTLQLAVLCCIFMPILGIESQFTLFRNTCNKDSYFLQFDIFIHLVKSTVSLFFPPPPHFRYPPQVAIAITNQDGGSSIEAYESRKSHGKIGDCEQSR